MNLQRIQARQFRNYESIDITFSPSMNIIHGLNAQGKSNLVEAIAYLANTRSFRGHSDAQLVQENKPFFALSGVVHKGHGTTHLSVIFNEGIKKKSVDQIEVKRMVDYESQFHVVVFQPNDVQFFQAEPKVRRVFLDQELSQISPSYHYLIGKYNKLLKERNELLKHQTDENHFQIVTDQLVKIGVELTHKRMTFIQQLIPFLTHYFNQLYDEQVTLTMSYHSTLGPEVTLESAMEAVHLKKAAEIQAQTTLVGPHRDDVIFYLNEKDLSLFGSQGQQRLAVVALKLALLQVIQQQTGEAAVVCLDDVLSELDAVRQRRLLQTLTVANQIFITTTHLEEIDRVLVGQAKRFHINQGTIEVEEDAPWQTTK